MPKYISITVEFQQYLKAIITYYKKVQKHHLYEDYIEQTENNNLSLISNTLLRILEMHSSQQLNRVIPSKMIIGTAF